MEKNTNRSIIIVALWVEQSNLLCDLKLTISYLHIDVLLTKIPMVPAWSQHGILLQTVTGINILQGRGMMRRDLVNFLWNNSEPHMKKEKKSCVNYSSFQQTNLSAL